MIGGTRKRPSSAAGAAASTSSRSRQGCTTSARSTLTSGYGWVIGSTAAQVERVDVGEVLEHAVELDGHAFELVGRDIESGQPGHLGDIGCGNAVGHDQHPTAHPLVRAR